ncbi:MAG TPA: phospholipid carrier-dependent glycosyltransferase [Candidatus Acidoferrales bacterium]|nr:phospholipid carrier-dependent glycosyltransferase [Candidatus Acidoferrales bacterium]
MESRRRRLFAGLAVGFATLICLFGHLGAIGLVGPDEPRYAWIARAMAETGDWVTPRLYGSPWFEKPVLYYWTAALGFQTNLPPEWAARLPSAIAALAAALGIAWLGWKHYGFRECPWSPALLAPLFFSTSVAAIGFSRAATPDMLFSASVTLAMACAATMLRHAGVVRGPTDPALAGHRGDFTANFGFGAFLGLAVLAKGPVAIILAGGAIGIWALATKHWRAAFRMLHPVAIASFCVVALPWYVLCARRNPDFLRVFLFQHNFERYVSDVFQHRQPFWFFIPITLLALIPWTAFLIPAAREGLGLWRAKSWRDSPAFFFSCWAMFPVLFFSFSPSKLPSYILPGIPALALVMAVAASRVIEPSPRADGWVFALVGLTWLGLAAAALVWTNRFPGGTANPARVSIIACAVAGIAGGMLITRLALSHQRAALWVSLLLVCALAEFAGIAILPRLDPYYSARSVGAMLRSDLRPDRLFVYELPRASQYGLAFYLGRQLPEWAPTDFDAALVLTTPKGFDELRARGLVEGTLDESHQAIVMVPVRARSRGVRE